MKYRRRVFENEICGKNESHFVGWGDKERSLLLEGYQASSTHPSNQGSVKVKTLEWLEIAG
jgi:hypothetical protein